MAISTKKSVLRIALANAETGNNFYNFVSAQIEDEALLWGNIEITIFDGKNSVAIQSANLLQVIEEKFDGLLIYPVTSDTMAPAVQKVVDANIPVVSIDRPIDVEDILAFVGGRNIQGGQRQGLAFFNLFPTGGTLFEINGLKSPGAPSNYYAQRRQKGLHDIIDHYSSINLLCNKSGQFTETGGKTATEACLEQNGVPNMIIAANDDMAFGAISALQEQGLKYINVLGCDAIPEALAKIEAGTLYGTIELFHGKMARIALDVLVKFLRYGVKPNQHNNYTDPVVITKENLRQAEQWPNP